MEELGQLAVLISKNNDNLYFLISKKTIMDRRNFIKNTGVLTAGAMLINPANNIAGFYTAQSKKKVAVVGRLC